MQQLTLRERVDNWAEDFTVDLENRLVKNVALAGQLSRNGYRYADEALAGAAPLYENKPVFLDHAGNRQRPLDRSTRDLVGSIVNAHYGQGRVRGDIRVLDTESGQTFLKLVEAETPGVGMSHVVLAQRTADGKTVDRIVDVVSVDVVINPATTSTFRESMLGESSEAVVSATESAETPDLEVTALLQERDGLLNANHVLRRQLADLLDRDAVRQLIAESGLPPETVSDCFQTQLLRAASSQARRDLIEDRLRLLREGRPSIRAFSHERAAGETSPRDDEFLRVLRRRSAAASRR
ncbi:hypothetical protein [Planctomicrobium piriforme]|uniref:Uncharacterized protein n=1 Tax=Planctomicrobium piriforme TaxID=1576369 RepID=A0A1I3TED9_9PLAN|nr:hypothetical protein [Planctomicrobium piriforme]SFJ68863.1 hypothetical protein SAMN05421753_12926 [Planctomicrobium piriforme]